jgi:Uma2 family endonuclease
MIVPNNPTTAQPQVPPARLRLRRFNRDEYLQMAELGFFDQGRYELINGRIVRMPTPSPPHVTAMDLTRRVLEPVFGPNHYVRVQSALDLSPVFVPDPDLAVVPGSPLNWATAHPTAADTRLVVEVSRSTLWIDRKLKLPLYAAAGVADLWIINLINWQLEVYRKPRRLPGKRHRGQFDDTAVLPLTATVTPLAAPQAVIKVADLFPPPPPPPPSPSPSP